MKQFVTLFLLLSSLTIGAMDATMYKWKAHFAFGAVTQIEETKDQVFGLAGGALFSVDKYTEAIQTYSKQEGLNGGEIVQIKYDKSSETLIIAYTDGLIDFLHKGVFYALTDLQQKMMSSSKQVNKIELYDGMAYFCMPFGIMMVDVANRLIKDTYYIGNEGSDVNVLDFAMNNDSLFAISASTIYSINRKQNPMDYNNWKQAGSLPADSSYRAISVWKNELFVIAKKTFAQRKSNGWYVPKPSWGFTGLRISNDRLYTLTSGAGIFYLKDDFSISSVSSSYTVKDIIAEGTSYWLATDNDGIVYQTPEGTQSYVVNGPLVNTSYRMRFSGDKLIMVPGGYYVTSTKAPGNVMLFENDYWTGFTSAELMQKSGAATIINFCDAIIDPNDSNHYFVASLGTGLWEFRNNQYYNWYHADISFLDKIADNSQRYTWVDGLAYDSKGNLWMVNLAYTRNIKVLKRDGTWVALDHTVANAMDRSRDLIIWNQDENIKIITCNHAQKGLLVLDDNGTIEDQTDDRCAFRTEFVDQDENTITFDDLYSIAQTKEGALWVGTNAGVVVFDNPKELLTGNTCRKIKIPRNDGTNLADYLLGTEQINAIVVDGANRKWLGTQTSGLYLVSEDGLETINHFTTENSPLLDNTIMSLAIQPTTGRVFIGTGKGLMSYQSDASPSDLDYSNVYVYPNPVHYDYDGVITIKGLKDESIVHITDINGNLVCETRSNGGVAIWDGKTASGQRAATGVYIVLLNENNGGQHAVTKILLMH